MPIATYPVNENWTFILDNKLENVDLPHNIKDIPLNYFKIADIHKTAIYKKTIDIPSNFSKGKVLELLFQGVGSVATVYCNDTQIFKNYGAYHQFSVDLTEFALVSKELNIKVEVDNNEDSTVPPFGGKMDYLTFGGIYRKVSLVLSNKNYIKNPKVETHINGKSFFSCDNNKTTSQKYKIFVCEKTTGDNLQIFEVEGKGKLSFNYKEPKLWSLENPNLYKVVIKSDEDEIDLVVGFKKCEFKGDGFYLNDKKIKLQGLNRHQCYAYVGYAMPENFQRQDVIILKEMGINLVRTSHYPQSPEFLKACDELGLLVFEEIPGWQFLSKDEVWLKRAETNVKLMIERDFHHPSIILWGVRINESLDQHELYTKTNKLAHSLDTTRQTGGVRYLTHSELLEDVYTFNDFIYKGNNEPLRNPQKVTKSKTAPYLVTEYCGHMFPTKPWDCESRRMEFGLRHASILNAMYANDRITGGIGWCFFDYQTHSNFGNGDMFCYHGVSDIFRVPKFAFYIYKAQNCSIPFVVSGTFFDAGDFSQFYQNKYVFFTNTDSIKLYIDNEYLGEFYPDKKNYPALKHPPIIITNLFQNRLEKAGFTKKSEKKLLTKVIETSRLNSSPDEVKKYALGLGKIMLKHKLTTEDMIKLGTEVSDFAPKKKPDWRIEGIKNGKVVCTQNLKAEEPLKLTVETTQNTFSLVEYDTFQVAQVTIKAGFSNYTLPAPYCFDSLSLKVSGAIELYGTPSLISLRGGIAGVFVRTKGITGEGKLEIESPRFPLIEVKFNVTK